jgi:hypothetical protein
VSVEEDVGKGAKGRGFAVGQWFKGRAGGRVLECVLDVLGSSYDFVDGGGEGHGDFCWEPLERVGSPLCAGFPDPDTAVLVQIRGWADVPAIDSVGSPRGTYVRCLMHEDSDARWCNGCAVEGEGAIDLGTGRQSRVQA